MLRMNYSYRCCSVAKSEQQTLCLFATWWTAAGQDPLSSTISWSLLKFMSIELVMLYRHLILYYRLQSRWASETFPMRQLFALGGQGIGASASASVFQWIFRLISFRIYWFDLAFQRTLKSFQHHSSKASSSPAFHMMYSAYMLNKQGGNIQPWCHLFSIWNQSVVPYRRSKLI